MLKDLIEEKYASEEEDFRQFVECYAGGRTDEGIKDYILNVYEAAMSHPYPEEWLKQCLAVYETDSLEELEKTEWMKLLWEAVISELEEDIGRIREAKEICISSGGPYLYEEALDSDLELLEFLINKGKEQDFDEISAFLSNLSFARLSGKKMEGVQEKKKEHEY